jgi:hypothetical protein
VVSSRSRWLHAVDDRRIPSGRPLDTPCAPVPASEASLSASRGHTASSTSPVALTLASARQAVLSAADCSLGASFVSLRTRACSYAPAGRAAAVGPEGEARRGRRAAGSGTASGAAKRRS